MPTLHELKSQLEAGQTDYKASWDAYPRVKAADGSMSPNIPASDLDGLNARMADLNKLGAQIEALEKSERLVADMDKPKQERVANRVAASADTRIKGLADQVLESKEYKSRTSNRMDDFRAEVDIKAMLGMERKTTMTTAAGFAPFVSRDGDVIPAISRPPQVLDYLPVELTKQNAVKFMKQTTRTNTAAPKAEGSAFDEATLAYTEATVEIKRIGVHIPITEEQMEDEDGVRALVEQDLILMSRQVLDDEVTTGDHTGQHLKGLINLDDALSGSLSTDEFDLVLNSIVAVRTDGRARPNLIVLNSLNHAYIVGTRTSDGIYIMGQPTDAMATRMWGLPIANSEALTDGTGIVMDTDYVRLVMRRDVSVAVTDSHSDDFIKNILRIRAHVRAGLKSRRDEAVLVMSGLRSAS